MCETVRRMTKVRPAGFEPATCGLEVRCSIQLSYGRMWRKPLYCSCLRPSIERFLARRFGFDSQFDSPCPDITILRAQELTPAADDDGCH